MLRALAIVLGASICAFGLALVFDFKGFASWHVKRTRAIFDRYAAWWPLRLSGRTMRNFDRMIGGWFAVVGLLAVIASIFGQVTVD